MKNSTQLKEFPNGSVPSEYDYTTFSSRLRAVLQPSGDPGVKLLASVVSITRREATQLVHGNALPKPSLLRRIAHYVKKPESYFTKGTILENLSHLTLVKETSPVVEPPKPKIVHLVQGKLPLCKKVDLPNELEELCKNTISAIDLARTKLAEANKILDDAESALKVRLSRIGTSRHKSWGVIKKSHLHS